MRSRVRSALLLFLLGTLVLEAVFLVQPLLGTAIHMAYPGIAMDHDGNVIYYDTRRDDSGALVRDLDTTRTPASIVELGPKRAMWDLAYSSERTWTLYLDFEYPRFLTAYRSRWHAELDRFEPLERVASILQGMEATRRGIKRIVQPTDGTITFPLAPNLPGEHPARVPITWSAENGRLVCRELATGRVLAGAGPDGYATGDRAAEGERFKHIDAGPFSVLLRTDNPEWLLLDTGNRRLHALSVEPLPEGPPIPADSLAPLNFTVETRPLHPFAKDESNEPQKIPCFVLLGRRVIILLPDGSVLADFELDRSESFPGVSAAVGVWVETDDTAVTPDRYHLIGTDLSSSYIMGRAVPLRPIVVSTRIRGLAADTQHQRLRLFRPGEPDIVRDVVLVPTRGTEVFLANVTASLALLRPPPLVLASALSQPAVGEHWWWRDPWLAGGRYTGWLLASLALAALLAWRARRAARERCATIGHVRFWTVAALLLGPIGFLWMKLVLPRVPVEPVGGARRAVNLDAAPSTSAPWPEPQPHGIEIFS